MTNWGIRQRIVGSYLLLIVATVILVEGLILYGIRSYYLDNIEETLAQHAQMAAHFASLSANGGRLTQQAPALVAALATVTSAEIHVLDANGQIIGSSVSAPEARLLHVPSFDRPTSWQGTLTPSGELVLAVSSPIRVGNQQLGAVRLVTSLLPLRGVITRLAWQLAGIGLVVVIAVALLGMVLSASVIRPVKEITRAADQIATGDLTARVAWRAKDELGQLADTLNRMAAELARLDRLKAQFISSVSHELRTPLTSLKGWVVTLRDDETTPAQRQKGMAIMEQETDRLTRLVDQLLDFGRLEAHALTLHQSQFDLIPLIRTVSDQMRPRATRSGMELIFAPAVESILLRADAERLKQVLINLLDNAIKHVPRGSRIEVRAVVRDGLLSLAVCDNGPGIDPEDLPYVCQRFYQGKNAASGSGLGLALCREIAELHGGSLRIDSSPGQGTVAELRLPLAPTGGTT